MAFIGAAVGLGAIVFFSTGDGAALATGFGPGAGAFGFGASLASGLFFSYFGLTSSFTPFFLSAALVALSIIFSNFSSLPPFLGLANLSTVSL